MCGAEHPSLGRKHSYTFHGCVRSDSDLFRTLLTPTGLNPASDMCNARDVQPAHTGTTFLPQCKLSECYAARRSPLRGNAGLASRGTYGQEIFNSLQWTGPRIKLDRTSRASSSRPHPNASGTRMVMPEHDRVGTGSIAVRGYVREVSAAQRGGRARVTQQSNLRGCGCDRLWSPFGRCCRCCNSCDAAIQCCQRQ
jgi:hypothetical protein